MTANENSENAENAPAEEQVAPERFPNHYLTQAWRGSFFQPSLSMHQRPSPEVQAKVDAFIDEFIRDVKESFKVEDFMDTDHIIHKDLPKIDLNHGDFYIKDGVPVWPESLQEPLPSEISDLLFANETVLKEDYDYIYVFSDMHMQVPREALYVDLSPEQEENIQTILDKRAEERGIDEDGQDN